MRWQTTIFFKQNCTALIFHFHGAPKCFKNGSHSPTLHLKSAEFDIKKEQEREQEKEIVNTFCVFAPQVVCFRSVRCKAVDDGDHSAPRTEKSTAQDGLMLSPRDPVYRKHRSSQVAPARSYTVSVGANPLLNTF